MKIVLICGGLGNQIFQYAFVRRLQLISNEKVKIDTKSFYEFNKEGNETSRQFILSKLNCCFEEASNEEIHQLKYKYGLLSVIWRRFSKKFIYSYFIKYSERYLTLKGDLYFDGFWQSPKYFNDIRHELLKEITPSFNLSNNYYKHLKKIESCNSVSLHVRRGDYLSKRVKEKYGLCSIDYYRKAVQKITESIENPVFFIFSDDMDWVKENFSLNSKVVFLSHKGLIDLEELFLMSKCKHNIIANSTFSWWGAWLNQNLKKMIICPDPWFDYEIYDKSLIPKSWILISK